jgi:hypothetical protein
MKKAQDGLTRKQQRGIIALLSAGTMAAAAAEVGVNETTLRRWMKEEPFAKALSEARQQSMTVALSRLQAAAGTATTGLVALLGSADENVALRAILGLLDRALKGAELLDLLPRIEKLERDKKQRGVKR